MSTVLVTGGAGMIGSNLVKQLLGEGYEVKVVDNLWRGKLEYLNDESGTPVIDIEKDFYNIDLSVPNSCDALASEVDYIIHLADIVAGINYVFNNQSSLFRQNLLINSNVITSARKAKATLKGLVYIGTACSFPLTLQNSLDVIPLKEEDLYPALPESAYGWSKLMGQYETELLEKETGIPTCTLMLHNVYGSPADFTPERSQVIPSLIRKALSYPNEKFEVWGSGEQGRAFIHVNDVVNAISLALRKGLGEGTIQIGPPVCTSIKDIAYEIIKISKKDINPYFDLSKPEGDKARSADHSKASKVLGWQPQMSLSTGLEELYTWIESKV
jgi:nucleoside-diphosphate-sugar epimerase